MFDIGLIGLGVMGRSLALNMLAKGIRPFGFDVSFDAAITAMEGGIACADSFKHLLSRLPRPRVVLLMLPAFKVDSAIDALSPFLEGGDILIDGGNSHFAHTAQREVRLLEKGVRLIGLGVSGGEEGARSGPSLMAGGDREAYRQVYPLLSRIAAQEKGEPCLAHFGAAGAGHYIKMVHNGIEYAVMQLISEFWLLLKRSGLDHNACAQALARLGGGLCAGYLLDIAADIVGRTVGGAPLTDLAAARAGQKGTGTWAVSAALEGGVPAPSIAQAVFSRMLGDDGGGHMGASGGTPESGEGGMAPFAADASSPGYQQLGCDVGQTGTPSASAPSGGAAGTPSDAPCANGPGESAALTAPNGSIASAPLSAQNGSVASAPENRRSDERPFAGGKAPDSAPLPPSGQEPMDLSAMEEALSLCIAAAFAQGLDLIAAMPEELRLSEGEDAPFSPALLVQACCRVWRQGCIIRGAILPEIERAYEGAAYQNLLSLPPFFGRVKGGLPALKEAALHALSLDIPAFALSSSLHYIEAKLYGNEGLGLVALMRDCFGAHGFNQKGAGARLSHFSFTENRLD